MNPVLNLIIICIIMWTLNFLFGFLQIKHFNKNFIELRKLGRVAIGKKKGHLRAGTVVMLVIDDEERIIVAKKIQGITIFASVKRFLGLEGKKIYEIEKEDLNRYNRLMRAAIEDAINNYRKFKADKEATSLSSTQLANDTI
ncbi:sorbitol operon activator protein (glucitol) [Clostridium polyendosporum]|uniref:Sorbitol operon activator protein (Glucitol) n=1 Tax=Clostridium polyendosporum TaxID=69208 RepID=A0A919RXU4_9CLOT|nr:transcriptional regulator GutM [Clostridium polyendosporum]GIM28467.1 sorbitol operon activator protein (glucitol) [Clostridium polyendosporum]